MLWLVKQPKPWEGWYREATYFGPHLEEQYQQGVGIAEGESVFPPDASGLAEVHPYKHDMSNPDVMTQTRFWDKDRRDIMYMKEIVRVFKTPLPPPRPPVQHAGLAQPSLTK